jgi:hypothetical protein
VSQCGLAIYIKTLLSYKAKEEINYYGNSNISPCKKILIIFIKKKSSLKNKNRNQNPSKTQKKGNF